MMKDVNKSQAASWVKYSLVKVKFLNLKALGLALPFKQYFGNLHSNSVKNNMRNMSERLNGLSTHCVASKCMRRFFFPFPVFREVGLEEAAS